MRRKAPGENQFTFYSTLPGSVGEVLMKESAANQFVRSKLGMGGAVFTTTNRVSWTQINDSVGQRYFSPVFSLTDGTYLTRNVPATAAVVSPDGFINARIPNIVNESRFTQSRPPSAGSYPIDEAGTVFTPWKCVASNQETFVVVSSAGHVGTSRDGFAWRIEQIEALSGKDWSSMAYGDGQFKLVCSTDNTVATIKLN
jgi:hypothetical protein